MRIRTVRAKVISACALFSMVCAAPSAAQVAGLVVDAADRSVSQVEVIASGATDSERTTTDDHGRFQVSLAPPLEVTARKRGFGSATIEVTEIGEDLRIRLPLSPYADQLVVEAGRDTLGVPRTASVATASPAETAGANSSVTDLVASLPSVSQNGQGGLLQVFSLRGLSRHRVLTLFDGMRIVSERRAGTSTSFVDPQLIEGAEVVRGPASSRFGSGALGGVVNLLPANSTRMETGIGWRSDGDALSGKLGWGGVDANLTLAHRQSDDGESADGTTLFSRYRHTSILGAIRWGDQHGSWELRGLASRGRDIGKVSTDFPERTTLYQEDHWVGRLTFADSRHFFAAGVHPGRLQTEVRRGDQLNTVVNRATDWSASWSRSVDTRGGTTILGADSFGRTGVRATETESASVNTTLDGDHLESSGFATWEARSDSHTWTAGGRWTFLRQSQRDTSGESESAGSAFLGWAVDLPHGWDLRLHAGSGWRFPSPSERFFRGITGRGQVIGNPDLDPERSWSGEAGLRWTGNRFYTELAVHTTRIDDYIERVDLGDVRTFVNLDSGRIAGLEFAGSWSIGAAWLLEWGGHAIDGEAGSGVPLADIPPDRGWLGGVWSDGDWSLRGRLEQRLSNNDPASGELPLAAATVGSLRLEYGYGPGVFGLTVDNLFDETYRTAADDKLPPAVGRSIGLSWRWSADS